jgi:hypothetical protein
VRRSSLLRQFAALLRLQLTNDSSAFYRINLIKGRPGKARHEWGCRLHLLSAAASKSLIEQILTRGSHLWCTDPEIVGSTTLNLHFAFIIHSDRIHTGYPVSAGWPVYKEIQSFGYRTNRLTIDLDSHFRPDKTLLAQKIQSREPGIPLPGLRLRLQVRLRFWCRFGNRRGCASGELNNNAKCQSPRYETPHNKPNR